MSAIVESEIIPRLMLVHARGRADARFVPAGSSIAQAEVDALVQLLAKGRYNAIRAFADDALGRGVPRETMMLDLLAPAARQLGVLWERDEMSFVDVTLGVASLRRLLHEIGPELPTDDARSGRRILLAGAPNEQHTFGLVILADMFRREGWDVQGGFSYDAAEVHRLVVGQWFAVVGFSIGTMSTLGDLATAIKVIREKSCNPSVRILVGGRAVNDVPDLCTVLRADACTNDAREALRIATAFCPQEDGQHH